MAHPVLSKEAEEYLSWLAVERGRAAHTLAAYRGDLVRYEAFLAQRGTAPPTATADDLEAYLGQLRGSGHASSSVNRARSALKGLHHFLYDEAMAAGDPTGELGGGRVPQRLPKALSEPAVDALLQGATGTDPRSRRDRALLELLYGCGARISEAVGLDLADLAVEEGLVRLYGKGSKERLVPLGRCATEALFDWLAPSGRPAMAPTRWRRRGDAEAVFLNVRGGRLTRQGAFGIVRHHARAAGLGSSVSPHVLRHSCATHMLAHGADIRVVQELLGHASIATTQLYTKVSPEHLRAVYDQAHPRARTSSPKPSTAPLGLADGQ